MRTVVLDGDVAGIQIDGELDLVCIQDGEAELITEEDGEADLVIIEDGAADLVSEISGELGVITKVNEGAYPAYTGPTEITPTQAMQTLSTRNTSVLTDIVINPIPSNYGLITWNGSTLLVS